MIELFETIEVVTWQFIAFRVIVIIATFESSIKIIKRVQKWRKSKELPKNVY